MKTDFDKKFQEVVDDNEELRRVWDSHMNGIRQRVIEDSEDEDEDEDTSIQDNTRQHDNKLDKLSEAIDKLTKDHHDLDVRLIQLEQYTRRESLVFTGIPANIPQQELENTVLEIMFHLGFKALDPTDICAAHRLSSSNSRQPAKVIVKFVNRKIVEWSLSHPENLAIVKQKMGLNLSMSESLCAKNIESLNICTWLLENDLIHHYYTRNGFMKVVIAEGDSPIRISHPDPLRKIFAGVPSFPQKVS